MTQDLDLVAQKETTKLNWKMICLSLNQIKTLINFFKKHVQKVHKGSSNLIGKIEFYDEDESLNILTEKKKEDDIDLT